MQVEVPRMSMAEREARWARVRAAMAREGIDCLVVRGESSMWDSHSANVRYLVQGFMESGAVFPLAGDPTLFIWGSHHIEWFAGYQDWVQDIRFGRWQWAHAFAERIRELGLERGRIGVVGLGGWTEPEGIMPHTMYQELVAELPEATMVNATVLVEEQRVRKSAEEIAMLEKAAELGDRAVQALAAAVRAGRRDYEVHADVVHNMLSNGSEWVPMLIWESGPVVAHPRYHATHRIIQPGDVFINEISPRWCGYWGHPHQPVSCGPPKDPIYLELFKVAAEAFHTALDFMRPGVTVEELDAAVTAPIRKAGYTWTHPCIHGIGLMISEAPRTSVAQFSPPRPNLVLEPGMAFAVEPIATTPDRTRAIPFCDTVVITETGCRRLGKRPVEFIIT